MRSIINILTFVVCLSLSANFVYAEDEVLDTSTPEVVKEDTTTLTDTLSESEITTTTEKSAYSFSTILLAFLIPAILLIICYLMFRYFKF